MTVSLQGPWSVEPPTHPGYYWVRDAGGFLDVVCVDDEQQVTFFFDENGPQPLETLDGVEWAGPLTPPAERSVRRSA